MSKQINEYDKSRNRADITTSDLLDVDSSDDNGTTYESAKLPIGELTQYIANIFTFYREDGMFPITNNNRTVDFNTGKLKFQGGGDVELRGTGLSNYGFSVQNLTNVERARLGTDDALDTGEISLSNSSGEFFNASDGKVAIRTSIDANAALSLKSVGSGTSDAVIFKNNSNVELFRQLENGRTFFGGATTTAKVNIEGTSATALEIKAGSLTSGTNQGLVITSQTLSSSTNRGIDIDVEAGNGNGGGIYGIRLNTAASGTPDIIWALDCQSGNVRISDELLIGGFSQDTPSEKLHIEAGNALIKSDGSDVALLVQDNLSQDRAIISYDSGLDTGEISLSNSAGEFFSASDGFVGLGTDVPFADEKLRVSGKASFSTEISIGNEPFNGAAIAIPNNQGLAIGGTFRIGATSGITYIDAGLGDEIIFRDALNFTYAKFNQYEFNLNSNPSTSVINSRDYNLKIKSTYWDGSASQEKESSIVHNITSSPSGDSQLDFSIAGTDILTLKDTGVLNAPNLPTSSSGLVTGDIWNDGGTLKIV